MESCMFSGLFTDSVLVCLLLKNICIFFVILHYNNIFGWLQPATELIREVAVLELEVAYLEQYLLSLYRKAFDQQISSVSPPAKDERSKSPINTPKGRILQASRPDITSMRESSAVQSGCEALDNPCKEPNTIGGEKLLDSAVHRCHSSLSQRSAFFTRTQPPADSLAKALRACHSQPLSMMEVIKSNHTIHLFLVGAWLP